MVKDAFYFLVPLKLATLLAAVLGQWVVAALLALLVLFVAWFFRNPQRRIPSDAAAIVSPADGKVIRLEATEEGSHALSIFLSIFDVHVNRAPMAGEIVRQEHRPGKFLAAWDHRASVENEQLLLEIVGESDRRLTFSLIAGLVARRIVPWKSPGDTVCKGDRIGLIRFGSRVDVLLPRECEPQIRRGDRVKGGTSVIAVWK